MFVRMERAINRRQQGDLGEASAIEWLTSRGALVLVPFGHSPDFDLVARIEDRLLRIQVKTSTQETRTASGHVRYPVSLVTCGGNQSWNGVVKKIDPETIDYLFILTGRGRRWLIPSTALEGQHTIQLGGPKYSECEIEPGRRITENVFGRDGPLDLPAPGEYPRGQRTAAVNGQALPSQVRLLPPPLASSRPVKPTNYERKPGQRGEAVINQKRRVTIPQRPFFEAGFANGGRVRVRADGPGRIVIEEIELPEWAREPAGPERRAPG
jgi:PD-(D/E)XK endonuclease